MLNWLISYVLSHSATHDDRLKAISYPSKQVPSEYLCRISMVIMTTPMLLDPKPTPDPDQDWIVDKAYLNSIWETNYNSEQINPFTNVPITCEPKLDTVLLEKIAAFVAEKEAIVRTIASQFKEWENQTEQQTKPAPLDRLRSIDYNLNNLPTKFRDTLLGNNEPMKCPIRLDGNNDNVVDFYNLQKWWTAVSFHHKKKKEIYCNKNLSPFTFNFLEKIEFVPELIAELEEFIRIEEQQHEAALNPPTMLCNLTGTLFAAPRIGVCATYLRRFQQNSNAPAEPVGLALLISPETEREAKTPSPTLR